MHDQMASRSNRVPEPAEHGNPLRKVEEHQACVDKVVGCTRNRGVTTQVVGVELALSVTLVAQPCNAVRTQGLVDVDTYDPSPRTDPLGQLTHRHPGSAAGVQATRARGWIHPVQHPLCGTLPDLCRPVALLRHPAGWCRARRSSRPRFRWSSCLPVWVAVCSPRPSPQPESRASWPGPRGFDNAMDTSAHPAQTDDVRDGLLQRSEELAALERQLQQIRAGAGRVLVVQGPAGVGKSSLVRAVTQSASVAGVRAPSACGGPLEQEAGWGVVRQLFGSTAAGPEWEHLGVGAAALARRVLDPDPFAPTPTGDAVHAASYGLSWLAYGLAERRPTLLVVDDVHWADAPSLALRLAQLSAHLADLRLGVLCAVRSGEPATEPATLADLMAAAPEPPLQPRPLGPDAVEALVTERLPGAHPAFVAACHAASAGNPFLLGALVDQVVAEGVEPSSEVAARLTTFGPEQVGRSVEVQSARRPRAPPTSPEPSRFSAAERCCAKPPKSRASTSSGLITSLTGWWPAAFSDVPMTGSR